jgi:uncharacterized protein (DUF362 family)
MHLDDIVSICGKKGPIENVKSCLKELDLTPFKNKSVLLKPNVGRSAKPEQGYNTHPLTLAGIIEVFKNIPVAKIAIGESPLVGIDTFEAFDRAGITEIANKYDVELIDLDAKPPIKKEIPNCRVVDATKICSRIYDFDFLVSVPVAKTHMHTGVTLGIKNMKGCLYRHEKVRYHQLEYKNSEYPEKTLDSAISDLAMVLMPDFTIIDGYIGMEGLGPSGGTPIKSDFVVASWNNIAADVLGCILMGIDPAEIHHLRLISERTGRSLDPGSYKVVPADFEKYCTPYKRPPTNISMEFEHVVVYDKEACSSCLSTLMLFLRRFRSDMVPYLLSDGNFHIAIGKGVKDTREGTVFVGNCSKKKCNGTGIFVPGCPPVPTRIYEAITGVEPEENEPEVK